MAKLKVEKTTDLIAFADSIADEDVIKMLQYRKVMTGREDVEILDPSDENFVLWAKNPENVKTNLSFASSALRGLIYLQLYIPSHTENDLTVDGAWSKSPAELYPDNIWEDISDWFKTYPFFRAYAPLNKTGSKKTVGEGHLSVHSHYYSHSHRISTYNTVTGTSSGVGWTGTTKTGHTNYTDTYSDNTNTTGTYTDGTTSSDSAGNYPEPNYSSVRIWICRG